MALEKPNPADLASITGGVITTIGAFNLDKPWAVAAVGIGKAIDGVDGWIAESLGVASEAGGRLDKSIDRITEGAIVAGLVGERIVPAHLPIIGYSLKIASRFKEQESTPTGNLAMLSKDFAIGAGVLAVAFSKESSTHKILKTSAKVLGWCAVGLGVHELVKR